MFLYFASLIEILEQIDKECRLVIEDIESESPEYPSAKYFADRIRYIESLVKENLAKTPLVNAPRFKDLSRHISFGMYYSTKQPGIQGIQGNLQDIILYDIPAIRQWILEFMEGHIDGELLEVTKKRLQNNDYIGAVRAAFPLFSQRMRLSFGIDASVKDGAKLIDKVFGETTTIHLRNGAILTGKEKESFNSLLKGLYQLVRNNAIHEHDSITLEQADAALATLNYVLRTIKM
ncbi:hypothetical protein MGLY_20590 [Neomoorella glycerini]|uniref:Conserved hypothetical protein CHP02391 domain-containing protein n=1 Tax=Neomoorella glycerini TaxID=55779 RepID=A0A6I5ZTG1_9FIRM|nr:TIGR02391 family protein [Moorella glycerini]QGP92671.1 hypothetical protein MGLY_20590 [Moorella glycerini]